ncbi:MAG TPA: hypothetical protein VLA56_17235 [Pseudomonadales bacterium]|nr:hypothetical protein [Pseudomonadales bacterium]
MQDRTVDPSLVSYVHIMYALHALAAVIGITSPLTVVGQFIFGVPSLIAVIMNYVRRDEARGTWLESHFSWQLTTFWTAAVWSLVIWVSSVILMIVLIGFLTLPIGIALAGLWIIYRVARGWLALKDGKPVP